MKFSCSLLLIFITYLGYAQEVPEQAVIPPFDYGRDFRAILEQTKDKNSNLYYNDLLTKFQHPDSVVTNYEVLALMIGFTENPNYKPFEDMETEKEIIELNDNGFYQDALDESKSYLAKHPLSLSILKERSFAYHQLGIKDSAKYFMSLTDKIMEAMISSGKGRKMENAIFSLGLNDGDYFIPNVGMSVNKKDTDFDKQKRFMYVVDALTDENTHIFFYFNIHHAKLKMDGDDLAERTENKKLKKAKSKAKQKSNKKKGNTEEVKSTEEVAPAEEAGVTEEVKSEQKTEIAPDVPEPVRDTIPQ